MGKVAEAAPYCVSRDGVHQELTVKLRSKQVEMEEESTWAGGRTGAKVLR